MKTITELRQWLLGALEEFGDPSEPIAQIFCRWVDPIEMYTGGDLVCGTMNGQTFLRLNHDVFLPIEIETGTQGSQDIEGMPRYGASAITGRVWSLHPSFFVPRELHVFVTLYDVPIGPPWDVRIIPARKVLDFNRPFDL